ncbi:MAG: PQQ-dependent sugar dehydrogenase [Rubrivivax sp.]
MRPDSSDDASGMSPHSRRQPRPFTSLATLAPFAKSAAAALAAVLLLSCGGGGGDAGGSGPLPQTVTLTFPANGTDGLSGIVTLGAAAAAGAGIVAVEFQIDGVAITEDTTAPYAASLDTTPFSEGQHVIRARGRDAAGSRTAWSSAVVRLATGRAVPAGFTRNENWVGGLANAAAFALAPDGRIFVAEQGGNLRVVKNGALLGLPFVSLNVDSTGERGLVGVAVHPNFASNHFVYVYYTSINGAARRNRIVRYTATADVATDPGTPILELPDLSGATNHNGGGMRFGPDGKLYVGVGENGRPALAQDRSHPFGKILRLNDDGSTPGDNPFATTQTGQGRLVWAYGLRNPFTFAFQPGTGRMHINDVGEETWEEIDLGAAGANYGWPASEGFDRVGSGFTAPIFAYGHAPATGSPPGGFFSGEAIAGGVFYPASGAGPGLFPAPWRGNYFFADFLGRFVGLLDIGNDNAAYTFCTLSGLPVDMLVGTDAALYVLTRGAIARISTTP